MRFRFARYLREACLGKDVDIGESKKVLIRKFEDRFLN